METSAYCSTANAMPTAAATGMSTCVASSGRIAAAAIAGGYPDSARVTGPSFLEGFGPPANRRNEEESGMRSEGRRGERRRGPCLIKEGKTSRAEQSSARWEKGTVVFFCEN